MAKKAGVKKTTSVDEMIGNILREVKQHQKCEWTAKLSDEHLKLVNGLKVKVLAGEVGAAPVSRVLHPIIGGDQVVKRSTLEKWLRRT